MNRTIVRDVPAPPSPFPAPSLLRTWLAQVDLTSILRSTEVSIENTPMKTPAGARVSKASGGNVDRVKFVNIGRWRNAVVDSERDGGPAER